MPRGKPHTTSGLADATSTSRCCNNRTVEGISKVFDRLADAMIERYVALNGRLATAIAIAVYPGVGLVLPIVLDLPVTWLISINLTSVLFAALLLLGWMAARVETARRRQLLEWTTDLRHLDSTEFEWMVGELLRREGWSVLETGGQGVPDGNVDLRVTKAGDRRIVQCKRWQSWAVGVDEVRGFAGTLLREGLPGAAGSLFTLSDFTPAAIEEAKRTGIELVSGPALYTRIEAVRKPEPCPRCGKTMRLDQSEFGWWFHCTKACGGKRDLGRDPARAVELLTQQA